MSELIDKLKQTEASQFQTELAKTYFAKSPSKTNHFTQSGTNVKSRNLKQILTITTLGLLLILIATAFIFNRFEIIVNIIPAMKSGFGNEYSSGNKTHLSKGGELNRGIIKDIMFYGGADVDSSWENGVFTLSTEAKSEEAILGIDFKNSIDMTEKVFCFYAKGKVGGEGLSVTLRDTERNLCYSRIDALQSSWQKFVIDISRAGDFIDPKNITYIDFKIKSEEQHVQVSSTAYFKDLYITKRSE